MIRAGVKVGENSVVGAKSNVQGDVPAHHIAVGAPAESVKVKPGWESVADPLAAGGENRRAERRLDDELPEGLEAFDEFGRDLSPPDA
jgi:carbonic anhydrase/acetyltransferase-like protein (isoleucine patch superfamily)